MSDDEEETDPWNLASHFGLDNLPFGIGSSAKHPPPQCVSRYNNTVIFLDDLQTMFSDLGLPDDVFLEPSLNAFAQMGAHTHRAVRGFVRMMLQTRGLSQHAQEDISEVKMYVPIDITDFSIFSRRHYESPWSPNILNVSVGKDVPQVPISRVVRPSSVKVSGNPIMRPRGYRMARNTDETGNERSRVVFGPSQNLQFEPMLGIITGRQSREGQRVNIDLLENNIFGYVLMLRWNARDFERYEALSNEAPASNYTAVTITPWVVPHEAIATRRGGILSVDQPSGPIAPHLAPSRTLKLPQVEIAARVTSPTEGTETLNESIDEDNMPWNFQQMIAHQLSSGYGMKACALLAVTIPYTYGRFTEEEEQEPYSMKTLLKDGDNVDMVGFSSEGSGFGICRAQIHAALDTSHWVPGVANQRESGQLEFGAKSSSPSSG